MGFNSGFKGLTDSPLQGYRQQRTAQFVSTVVAFHFPIVKEILDNGKGVMICGLRPVLD